MLMRDNMFITGKKIMFYVYEGFQVEPSCPSGKGNLETRSIRSENCTQTDV
jgi:hypothetical protein